VLVAGSQLSTQLFRRAVDAVGPIVYDLPNQPGRADGLLR